jgi:hypothetical protein
MEESGKENEVTDQDYINSWRMRAFEAEIKVNTLNKKLMFWRAAGISFGIVTIIITLIAR